MTRSRVRALKARTRERASRILSMRWLALVLYVFPVGPLAAQSPAEKAATIKFLQELQVGDGGFLPTTPDTRLDTNPRGGLRATSAAVRALKYFGGAAKDKAAAAKFVASCYDARVGGFAEQPGGTPDVATTAIGVMATAEFGPIPANMRAATAKFLTTNARQFEEIRIAAAGFEVLKTPASRAEEWIAQLTAKVNPDGSYGRGAEVPRATGGTVACLLRLGSKTVDAKPVIKILDAGQATDGGFAKDDGPPDLETTYRVLRCYHMLKAKPSRVDDLRKLVAKCRDADGGYGVQPDMASHVSGTYYAGIILKWLNAED